jgi:poly-beta-1,6-N-acetyl-D-glucosamine synthase
MIAARQKRASTVRSQHGMPSATNRWSRAVQQRELVLFLVGFSFSLGLVAVAVYQLCRPAIGDPEALRAARWILASVGLFSGTRWSSFFVLSFLGRRQHCRAYPGELSTWPKVSILVPAYNESQTIEPALESLLQLDYPEYEVLVINDGSTDDTLLRARRYEGCHGKCTIKAIDKKNGGKWSAHNTGFKQAQGELILCIDSDSRLDPHSLKHMVKRMISLRVDAVAGQMRVRNRVNLITRLQGLEYLMANGAVRLGQGYCANVLIVPGPIGLFRRTAMEQVFCRYTSAKEPLGPDAGPFEGDTFAEDFDLSLSVLCLGGDIVYEPDALSFTKAPASHFALVNQRYRWIRGSLQVLRKLSVRAWREPRILRAKLVLWILATYVPDLLLLPVIYMVTLGMFFLILASGTNALLLFGWYAALASLQLLAGLFFISTHGDDPKLLCVLPFYGLYTGFVLTSAWIISVYDEVSRKRMEW